VRGTHRKVAAKFQEFRARKVAAKFQEFRAPQKPHAMPAFAEGGLNEFRATAVPASAKGMVDHQIEELHTQVPASMRALAEMNVAQTRALYQRSANAFEAAFESWQDCLDAAGQGAVAFNRKIMDIAERNISTGLDLATRLARAKNPVEAIEAAGSFSLHSGLSRSPSLHEGSGSGHSPPQASGPPRPWSNRTASVGITTLATVASSAPSLT